MNSIGIDMVDIDRFKDKEQALANRVLSKEEKAYYDTIKSKTRQLTFLAGRFAAKEAYTKMYQYFETPLNFADVSIMPNEYGAPVLKSKYRPNDTVLVSISHTDTQAIAVCQLVEKME